MKFSSVIHAAILSLFIIVPVVGIISTYVLYDRYSVWKYSIYGANNVECSTEIRSVEDERHLDITILLILNLICGIFLCSAFLRCPIILAAPRKPCRSMGWNLALIGAEVPFLINIIINSVSQPKYGLPSDNRVNFFEDNIFQCTDKTQPYMFDNKISNTCANITQSTTTAALTFYVCCVKTGVSVVEQVPLVRLYIPAIIIAGMYVGYYIIMQLTAQRNREVTPADEEP